MRRSSGLVSFYTLLWGFLHPYADGLMRDGKVKEAEQLVDRAFRAAQQGGDAP